MRLEVDGLPRGVYQGCFEHVGNQVKVGYQLVGHVVDNNEEILVSELDEEIFPRGNGRLGLLAILVAGGASCGIIVARMSSDGFSVGAAAVALGGLAGGAIVGEIFNRVTKPKEDDVILTTS